MEQGFKIRVNPKTSREVQEIMFSHGWEWVTGSKKIEDTDMPHLYFNYDKTVQYGFMLKSFNNYKLPELTIEQVRQIYGTPQKLVSYKLIVNKKEKDEISEILLKNKYVMEYTVEPIDKHGNYAVYIETHKKLFKLIENIEEFNTIVASFINFNQFRKLFPIGVTKQAEAEMKKAINSEINGDEEVSINIPIRQKPKKERLKLTIPETNIIDSNLFN